MAPSIDVGSRSPPPAATIMSVRAEDVRVAPFRPAEIEREAGGIGADALPRLHLALIALLGDLEIVIHRRERVHDVGREAVLSSTRRCGAAFERIPMGVGAFAERRDEGRCR